MAESDRTLRGIKADGNPFTFTSQVGSPFVYVIQKTKTKCRNNNNNNNKIKVY